MDNYTKLAKFAIENYVKTGKKIDVPKNLPKEMLEKKSGVFVSIHESTQTNTQNNTEKKLRGCIGTFLATKKNIAQEIIDNAISACSSDFRFQPIEKEELNNLEISVDVLSKPEPIQGITSLDTKKYGVIVKSKDGRTGLLLPDLPDIDTAELQVGIARQKAGISPEEPVYLYRFEVTRHK